MENLTITNQTTTVQAVKQINGNTANFSWQKTDGEEITAVNFNVQRGIVGEAEFNGNNIVNGAYYPQSGKFDVQNNNFTEGDFELYAGVLETCKEIVNVEINQL